MSLEGKLEATLYSLTREPPNGHGDQTTLTVCRTARGYVKFLSTMHAGPYHNFGG